MPPLGAILAMAVNPFIATAAGQGFQESGRVLAIVYSGATAAGHKAVIDAIGAGEIIEIPAAAANEFRGFILPDNGFGVQNGVRVSHLDSGKVYIFFKDSRSI